MKLIKIKLVDRGNEVFINPNQIATCECYCGIVTEVSMANGKVYHVKTPKYNEFIRMLQEDA